VTDRGIKRARFVVIKNIRIPGVLIEGGFVSNPYDARLIATTDYRQRIAQSILDAVQAYSRAVNGAAPAQPAVVTGKDESFTEASLQSSPTPAPPVGSSTSLDSTISKFDLNTQP
jgi:N-acetylmuramoyl-L-alanine amidase